MKEKEANTRRKSSIFSSFSLTGTSKASKDKEQGADKEDDNFEKNYEDKEEVIVIFFNGRFVATTTLQIPSPIPLTTTIITISTTNTNTTTITTRIGCRFTYISFL